MNILFIDTSDNKKVIVGLEINGKKEIMTEELGRKRAQVVLPLIEDLLIKHGLNLKDLQKIEVNPGPGSFTGLRVGISIANTLGTFLNIPINNNPPGKILEPIYQ